ncbi:polyketide synthase [Nocardia sp. NPDC049149]|uniref:beta-ketoacyl [acyl carrier protein] synthase domain-containing protein n=1 Tax=Nocardia sp. NPDC049149 TaxID=3364315 RepID=UPI00371CED21
MPHFDREPIAITGIACLHPEAAGVDEYWKLLTRPATGASQDRLNDADIDLARFGIPPAQRGAMSRLQLLMLDAAHRCLADAGYPARPLAERTDVIVGTCFGSDRQYANALRVEGARYARHLGQVVALDPDDRISGRAEQLPAQLRARLTERLGASPHDRVGEMASAIPARIATAFRLTGRTIAVESADATPFVALRHAVDSLRAGTAEAVLVLTGQCREGALIGEMLAAKGLSANDMLAEGVVALLLKRRSSALHDGDRGYASILECRVRHDPHPGVLRYATEAEQYYRVAEETHAAAGIAPEQLGYIDWVGPSIPAVTAAGVDGLGKVFGAAASGSVRFGGNGDRLGHGLANAGLASIAKTALALDHRALPPGSLRGADLAATPFRFPEDLERWPAETESEVRYAAVCGTALGGTASYLLLESYERSSPGLRPRPMLVRSAPATPEAIAIVGFGGAFADAPDATAFWQNIRSGRDSLRQLPDDVLDRDLYLARGALTLTHTYCAVGAAASIPEQPPTSLHLTPRRYLAMDRAQRLALSVAEETLARYGRRPTLCAGDGTVVVGSTLSLSRERSLNAERSVGELADVAAALDELADLPSEDRDRILAQAGERYVTWCAPAMPADLDGCLASGVAALAANEFRLSAVPLVIESACASTLAAIDYAVTALRAGCVDYAIAGGVELACNPRDLVLCSALGMLSRSRITPFDAEADGFSPGDGCAMFVLKRLSDAQRDGDKIYGLIRGVGAANDAKSCIAPNVDGQVLAMRRAFGQVEFEPAAVDYLEAHGTGTRVGDRVEITAAAKVYGGRIQPLVIGTAKSFIGHTFAAAGGAGLLRTLQAMRAETFPPTVLHTRNPELPLEQIPAVLPNVAAPWPAVPGRPRRAGVSSFGTGGINYHLLIEEYQEDSHRDSAS